MESCAGFQPHHAGFGGKFANFFDFSLGQKAAFEDEFQRAPFHVRRQRHALDVVLHMVPVSAFCRREIDDRIDVVGALVYGARDGQLSAEQFERLRPLIPPDGVIVSPHVSGFLPSYDERCVDLFAQNLGRYLEGAPLLNRVDRARGY